MPLIKSIIFIVGPTGVGKSAVGLELAKRKSGEIISCDSMQVYREVNIACDKPTPAMRQQIPHHLLDVVSVTETFDVARFRKLALEAIEDIRSRKKTPIIVGGSGMYMAVLLDGIFDDSVGDEQLRQQLQAQVDAGHLPELYANLKSKDPEAALKIHPHDAKRLIRALEVVELTGKPFSALQKNRKGLWGEQDIKMYALNRPRDILYQRAEARIDEMVKSGLVDEIKKLVELPLSLTAQSIIGIPEMGGHLRGEYDLERALYLMKRNTRHYIKRQMTWFRRDARLQWIDIAGNQMSLEVAEKIASSL